MRAQEEGNTVQEHLVHGTSLFLRGPFVEEERASPAKPARGRGILIQGQSGAGKSDLALRLLYEADAQLIADDYTLVQKKKSYWSLTCPRPIKGFLEVRGLGLAQIAPEKRLEEAPLDIVLYLSKASKNDGAERLPEPKRCPLFDVPSFSLPSFEGSLLSKVLLIADERGGFLEQKPEV